MPHAQSARVRFGLIPALLAALAWTGASAALVKVNDRKFPLSFCPLPLDGWQSGGSPVDLSFVAPSSSVRITFSSPNYYNGAFVNTHIDNVSVVLKSEFPDNPANVHDPSPTGPYYACYFPPGGSEDDATHTPSFVFTNFSWPGVAGPLLSLFDAGEEGWTGDVYFDSSFSAPRDPANEADTTGGALGIGLIQHELPATVSATRIVTGLAMGQEYVVSAWWYAEQPDTPLTLSIDSAACLDPDGDGFVDCSGAPSCEVQPGQTCGDCDETSAAIRPSAPDATCDGIDQNCSGQPDEGFPGGCQCAQRATGVVGWWRGDGNAEDWFGSNDGTITGSGVAFTGIGVVGEAFYFAYAQSGGVELPDAPEFEFTSRMTLEAWIRPDEMTESTRPIFSKMGLFDGAYSLQTETAGFLDASITDGLHFDGLSSPNGSLRAGVWAHVAMTFDSGLWKLYIDGELVASKLSTVTSIYDQGPLHPNIGRSPTGSLEFVGYIDEPAMYDRALSAAEIRAIYDAGAQGMCQCGASPLTTFYEDADADGYGDAAVSTQVCTAPAGYVSNGTDCDDADPATHPDATDATCNGIDNDCDGQLDEGFPGSCQCTMPAVGLLTWFPGDGDAIDVRGDLQGSLQNGATYAPGQVGQAFSFDGLDDYVQISNLASLDFRSSDFTIGTWVYLDSLLSDQEIFHKVSGTVPNDRTYFLEFDAPNVLRFMVRDGQLANQNDLTVATALQTGQWYHVAAVRSANTSALYLNGVLIGSQTAGNAVDTGQGGSARIGSLAPNGTGITRPFDGRIDEVQIYDRALGASEIQAVYAVGSGALCRCTDADFDGYGAEGGLTCPAGTVQDCDDAATSTRPGAPELCNGIDDDCDDVVDDHAAPAGSPSVVAVFDPFYFGSNPALLWNGVADATAYDVVRGDLGTLQSTGGDFAAAIEECIVDNVSDVYASIPAGVDGFFLVRPINACGNGSYDSGAPSQVGSRDAEIAASPAPCP